MKKKLLTLVLAATMVVGTAVTASATTNTKTTTVEFSTGDGSTTTPVTIDGTISTAQGAAPAGKVQVEVPTQMSFMVDKEGNFKSTSYTVKNKSQSSIKVSVESFRKRNSNGPITLKKKADVLTSLDRSNIKLLLVGDAGKEVDLGDFANASDKELVTVEAEGTKIITLQGEAGQSINSHNVDENGASDEFDMVFKIAKV